MSDTSSYRVPSLFEQAMEAWIRAIDHEDTTPNGDQQYFDLDPLGFALLDVLALVLERDPLLKDLRVTTEGPDTDEAYIGLSIMGRQQRYVLTLSIMPPDSADE